MKGVEEIREVSGVVDVVLHEINECSVFRWVTVDDVTTKVLIGFEFFCFVFAFWGIETEGKLISIWVVKILWLHLVKFWNILGLQVIFLADFWRSWIGLAVGLLRSVIGFINGFG